MAAIEWIKFIAGAMLLLAGTAIFVFEMIGVFRFKYVLNRMHAAAMGDTLGIGCCILGLIVMNGLNLTSLKLFLVIMFLWFSSPVSSHLIARLEVTTDEEEEKHYHRIDLTDGNAGGEALPEEAAARDIAGKISGRDCAAGESMSSEREREEAAAPAGERKGDAL